MDAVALAIPNVWNVVKNIR